MLESNITVIQFNHITMTNFTPIKPEAVENILEYLPFFKDNQEELYTYNGEAVLDPYTYHPKVNEFISDLYAGNFIQAYDWMSWRDTARLYMKNLSAIQQTDWENLIKLITYHIRRDRFVSGHLKSALDQQQFVYILERIEDLKVSGIYYA